MELFEVTIKISSKNIFAFKLQPNEFYVHTSKVRDTGLHAAALPDIKDTPEIKTKSSSEEANLLFSSLICKFLFSLLVWQQFKASSKSVDTINICVIPSTLRG